MAIDPTLGFGTVAGSSSATPAAILADCGARAISFFNTSTTNWLAVKRASGPLVWAGPGQTVSLVGGLSTPNQSVGAVTGFGCGATGGGPDTSSSQAVIVTINTIQTS